MSAAAGSSAWRRALTGLVVALGLGAGTAGSAVAVTLGPVCIASGEIAAIFRLFFREVAAGHFAVVGRDERSGRPVHGTLSLEPGSGTARLSLIQALDLVGTATIAIAADLGVSTGLGSGRCERLGGGGSACADSGTDVTFSPIFCPVP
jgi:hypothetical protein